MLPGGANTVAARLPNLQTVPRCRQVRPSASVDGTAPGAGFWTRSAPADASVAQWAMSVNPLPDLLKLPGDERAELAMALWSSLSHDERDGAFEVTPEQGYELDRRWDEHRRDPASAVTWEEVRRKLVD